MSLFGSSAHWSLSKLICGYFPYLRREEHSTQPIAQALPITPLLLLLRLAPPPQLAMVVSGCEAFSLTLDEHAALQGVGASGLGLRPLVRVSIIVAQASA